MSQKFLITGLLSALILILSACGMARGNTPVAITAAIRTVEEKPSEAELVLAHKDAQDGITQRSLDVPPLPFPDNPDPALCGIPRPWNSSEPAYLTGLYQGELIQPQVYLYDSHLRRAVVGQVPHGSKIEILLAQSNPALDYFLVKVVGAASPLEGWVPAPFVSFKKPPALKIDLP